jgi:kynurenine formamidase
VNGETQLDFRDIGKKVSNWNRWGADDRLGTLNHITAERLVAAARLVRTGKIFDLAIPLSSDGPQTGMIGRINPSHQMSLTPHDYCHHDRGLRPEGTFVADDFIYMPLQSVTQWDGLGHFGYDGFLYNGVPSHTVSTLGGSSELSIHQVAQKGIMGRAVLLDIAGLKGVDILDAGAVISVQDLEDAEAQQGVRVEAGDILIIRTGWLRHFTVHGDKATFWNGQPGVDLSAAEWLQSRSVAALAADNYQVEVAQPNAALYDAPCHAVFIRDMGMTLGELFDLEALAADCRADGIWEFLLSAPPLKVIGGVGTPITPIALK